MKLKLLILPALLALSKAAPTEPAPANDDAPAAPAGDVAATQDDYCNYCRIYYDDCMKRCRWWQPNCRLTCKCSIHDDFKICREKCGWTCPAPAPGDIFEGGEPEGETEGEFEGA